MLNRKTAIQWVYEIASLVVLLVERPGNGDQKKKEAISIVKALAQAFGLKLPEPFFTMGLSLIIDRIVNHLNKSLWKPLETVG